MELNDCTRQNLCVDCDNEKCWHQGKKEADCPKWVCTREIRDCEHCAFIDNYIEKMRGEYK